MNYYRKRNFQKIKKYRKVSTYVNSNNKNPLSLKAEFYCRGQDLGLSTATIYRYWRWVRRLILFYSEPIHPSLMTDKAILDFIRNIQSSDLSSSTIFQCIDAIRFLYSKVLGPRRELLNQLSKIRCQKITKKVTSDSVFKGITGHIRSVFQKLFFI